MVNYKITYFGARGRAETARQILSYAGVPFEDNRIDFAQWGSLKQNMPFGQIPILEVDGKMLAQSATINRYLARQFGLAGSNDWEAAKIDELNDGLVDTMANIRPWFQEKDPEKKKLLWAQLETDHFKPMLERYNKFLAANGTGYFVGSKISWFDITFAETISNWQEKSPSLVQPYPALIEFANKIRSNPNLKKWIENRPKSDF